MAKSSCQVHAHKSVRSEVLFLTPSPDTARMHRMCQPEHVYRTKLGVGGVGSVDLNKTSLLGCECCDELALTYFVAFIENAGRCKQNLIPDIRCEGNSVSAKHAYHSLLLCQHEHLGRSPAGTIWKRTQHNRSADAAP